jgi:hypothetical protein
MFPSGVLNFSGLAGAATTMEDSTGPDALEEITISTTAEETAPLTAPATMGGIYFTDAAVKSMLD